MAVTITRTARIDDDGTGTTGTVLNNAEKTSLYNEIDTALAKVAQLAGGNTFTGNQTITGLLNVVTFGAHSVSGSGTGQHILAVQNLAAGTNNSAAVLVGNDATSSALSLIACASTFTSAGPYQANGAVVVGGGAGGLSLGTTIAAAVRVYTNNAERMRVLPTGEVVINAIASLAGGGAQFNVAADASVHNGISIQNTNSGVNSILYVLFYNGAGTLAGTITQTGSATVSYGTSSDARLKDDDGRATDVAGLRAVVVHDFTWKADGRRARGVFAQEAHAVFPAAITEGTDETTDDGHLARPWMTDYSKFVPDLIVGWQQHDAELAELRAALATVKG